MATLDYAEISCDILHQSPDALLIYDGTKDVWLPLSQISQRELPSWKGSPIRGATIFVKEWLAQKEGLI